MKVEVFLNDTSTFGFNVTEWSRITIKRIIFRNREKFCVCLFLENFKKKSRELSEKKNAIECHKIK